MNRHVQLHVLTSYPPSNLNRDDTGRPKTALYGNAMRLRISSQCRKRAWRTSESFAAALSGHVGKRTRLPAKAAFQRLLAAGVEEGTALEWCRAIAARFGKLEHEKLENAKAVKAARTAAKAAKGAKKDSTLTVVEVAAQVPPDSSVPAPDSFGELVNDKRHAIAQLAHLGTDELAAIDDLVGLLIERRTAPSADELDGLNRTTRSVDIAMFGRMLADAAQFNIDAAIQVSHAITVHRAQVESDYFTAVDDLQDADQTGAGHVNERGYGAGLFYLYICIDRASLVDNLGGDEALARRALAALVEAVTTVSPTGMQNSFASRAFASHVLAEKGDQQPRTLAQAFLAPIDATEDETLLQRAVRALDECRDNFGHVYGTGSDATYEIDVPSRKGSLADLKAFVAA